MTIWIDAQLSPHLAVWIERTFDVETRSVKSLGLRDALDAQIFEAARREGVVVMTKDVDFVVLQEKHGPPPSIIWITCGNTSNAALRRILSETLEEALRLMGDGESLVEISNR